MTLQTFLNELTFTLNSKEKLTKGRVGYFSSYVYSDDVGEVRINLYTDQPEELKETIMLGSNELECIGINTKSKRFYSASEGHDLTVDMDATLPEETITLADLKDKKYEIYINSYLGVDNTSK